MKTKQIGGRENEKLLMVIMVVGLMVTTTGSAFAGWISGYTAITEHTFRLTTGVTQTEL